MNPADLIDVRTASRLTGVPARTLCWRARHGLIPAFKYPGVTGRYALDRAAVEALTRVAAA